MLTITATELPRVMNCDGPVSLAAHAVASDGAQSEYVIEGNAAHKVMQSVISGQWYSAFDMVGQTVNGNYIVTAEMAENLQPHIDCVLQRIATVHVEQTTDWHPWADDNYRISGRGDYVSVPTEENELYIDDLKYGWRIVEPEENWTLISHAIGFCNTNGFAPDVVHITIHQPRPSHHKGKVRTWSVTLDQLQDYRNRIRDRVSSISDVTRAGPYCYRCPVAHVCPSIDRVTFAAMDIAVSGEAEPLNNETLASQIKMLKHAENIIEVRRKALEAQAESALKSGSIIPGFGLDFAYGRKRWKSDVTAETVKLFTGFDVSKPDMITPTQAIKKGVPENFVEQWSETPSKGFKLVEMDVNKKAQELFGNG